VNSERRVVEKGIIFDIRRFSVNDGPGIRTTVFFKGCPLSCWWCHNPESRERTEERSVRHVKLGGKDFERDEVTGKRTTAGEVMQEIERDRLFYDESGGGVTFSGGEPLLQEAFLFELLNRCRKSGIHTALDTSGYATRDAMAHIAPLAGLVLFDLKIMDHSLHLKYTGVSNIPILENLKYLSGKEIPFILRFPVIPGINDTAANVGDMKAFITSSLMKGRYAPGNGEQLQISLLPYHAMAREKYRRFCKTNRMEGIPDLDPGLLVPLKEQFEAIGLKVTTGS